MSFAGGDEVPQISKGKPRLRPSEFLTPSAKRLLQHYPFESRHYLETGHVSKVPNSEVTASRFRIIIDRSS
jgi:hypothetical protein